MKSNHRRAVLRLAGAAALLGTLSSCADTEQSQPRAEGSTVAAGGSSLPVSSDIKIGVIVPTTGPGALLGQSYLKAVQMAYDDLAGTRNHYELVVEDSGTTPDQAETAIKKLIQVDQVKAVLGGISTTGKVVQPYATAAKIPHICVCSVSTIGDGTYNFTNIPLPQDEAKAWVDEATRRNIKTIAIFAQTYPSIDGHVKALKEEAAKAGMTIVYEDRFEGTTSTFRTEIGEASKLNPDVYFVSAAEPALSLLGRQLKDIRMLNLPVKIASIVAPSVSADMTVFNGDWYTDSNLIDPAFKARFELKYPDTRFATHMMPYAYDSVKMMVQALESGEDPAVYLRGVTAYDGSAGKITRDASTGNFRSTPTVWLVRNGKPVLASTLPPGAPDEQAPEVYSH